MVRVRLLQRESTFFFWGGNVKVSFCRNSARFLWKSIPSHVKEAQPEIVAVWKIGQCLWTRDYAGVFGAVRGFEWSAEVAGIITAFSGAQIFSF